MLVVTKKQLDVYLSIRINTAKLGFSVEEELMSYTVYIWWKNYKPDKQHFIIRKLGLNVESIKHIEQGLKPCIHRLAEQQLLRKVIQDD